MNTIWLIRHGECEVNTKNEFIGGQSNFSPLTDKGEIQARKLAHYLRNNADLKDSLFFSSTAVRAYDTARICLETLGMPKRFIEQKPRFCELDQGIWQGELRTDVYNNRVMELIEHQGLDFAAPDGESQRQVADRMERELKIQMREGYKNIYIFTHGVAIRCLMQRLFEFHERWIFQSETNNCSITKFNWDLDDIRKRKLIWWNNNTQV